MTTKFSHGFKFIGVLIKDIRCFRAAIQAGETIS